MTDDKLTLKQPAIIREAYAAMNEGPSPEGIANRLRRERDEAREERDRFRLSAQASEQSASKYWLLVRECALAFETAPRSGEFGLVPADLMRRVHTAYAEATGDFEEEPLP